MDNSQKKNIDRPRDNVGKTGSGGIWKIRYIFYIAAAVLYLLAILSYDPMDKDVLAQGILAPPANWVGSLGACLAHCSFLLFGIATYLLAVLVLCRAIRICFPMAGKKRWFWIGSILAMAGLMLLLALTPEFFGTICEKLGLGRSDSPDSIARSTPGGVIGQFFASPPSPNHPTGCLRLLIGAPGSGILGWAFLIAGALMILISDYYHMVKAFVEGEFKLKFFPKSSQKIDTTKELPKYMGVFNRAQEAMEKLNAKKDDQVIAPPPPRQLQNELITAESPPHSPSLKAKTTAKGEAPTTPGSDYVLPPITMIDKGPESKGNAEGFIRESQETLQATLDSFGINGRVTGYTTGPRVTRFEISLAPGVMVGKVESIASNIKMDLAAKSIRVLAPIPGRNAVGVEVPNRNSEDVYFRSMLESDNWHDDSLEIPIVLGKDIAGKTIMMDLAKAPHLLVAGATGTGKSVCMNTLIMSLIFRFRPDELKLIMVDPKVVEFVTYKTLPHLITPVVNEPGKASVALRWAVNEMEKRYHQLAEAGVKKLSEYNVRPDRNIEKCDKFGNVLPEKLPIIIVIVDEFADLMMTDVKKDVENSIARIAQKGRAAGIHIVLATQRPSRTIITGVIKANLPTKIAFNVGSNTDSRVILDHGGAELLLGKGDMLYQSPSSPVLERIQGAFVKDSDIVKVVDFVSAQRPPSFDDEVTAEPNGAESRQFEDDEIDESLSDMDDVVRKYMKAGDSDEFRQALSIVIEERKVSTSYLQRRLRIGYNRAAELIDMMEERKIIGPPLPGGNKREILITDGMEVNDND